MLGRGEDFHYLVLGVKWVWECVLSFAASGGVE